VLTSLVHSGLNAEICNKRKATIMRYIKPNVLTTVNASAVIQSGMGNTSAGLTKAGINRDNPSGPNPSQVHSTTSAYEADE
jgi:hypothetical protein